MIDELFADTVVICHHEKPFIPCKQFRGSCPEALFACLGLLHLLLVILRNGLNFRIAGKHKTRLAAKRFAILDVSGKSPL